MATRHINVLLLGESGVGKTTFINALANYLYYGSFQDAMQNKLIILAPTLINLVNEDNETVAIPVGNPGHEQEVGEAGTRNVGSYIIPLDKTTHLRLIDTLGIGDPRGVEQDFMNIERILKYLKSLKEVHAVCFLLKPTTSRINVLFEYCLKQLLTRLQVSSSGNVVFVFTSTRTTFYTTGDTKDCLGKLLDDIGRQPPHVRIPFNDDNVFCVDNEAFKHLAAFSHFQQLDEKALSNSVESWNFSFQECRRLISYVAALKPHQMAVTAEMNNARNVIYQHIKPLLDISQLIEENISLLENQKNQLKKDNEDLATLKETLKILTVSVVETELDYPITRCENYKCPKIEKLEGCKGWLYHVCYNECTTLQPSIFHKIASYLPFVEKKCPNCGCGFSKHASTRFRHERKFEYYYNEDAGTKIKSAKDFIRAKGDAITTINKLILDQKREQEDVVKSMAKFVLFLQANSISPVADFFEESLQEILMREKNLGPKANKAQLNHLNQILGSYNRAKTTSVGNPERNQGISIEDIRKTLAQLHQLKHNGKSIREMFENKKIDYNFSWKDEYMDSKDGDHVEHDFGTNLSYHVVNRDEGEPSVKDVKPTPTLKPRNIRNINPPREGRFSPDSQKLNISIYQQGESMKTEPHADSTRQTQPSNFNIATNESSNALERTEPKRNFVPNQEPKSYQTNDLQVAMLPTSSQFPYFPYPPPPQVFANVAYPVVSAMPNYPPYPYPSNLNSQQVPPNTFALLPQFYRGPYITPHPQFQARFAGQHPNHQPASKPSVWK